MSTSQDRDYLTSLPAEHKRFDKEDEDYIYNLASYCQLAQVWHRRKGKSYSLLGKLYNSDANNLRTKIINVRSPGPQYLHFLEWNVLIVCDKHRLLNCCSVRYDEPANWEKQTFRRDYEQFLDTFNLLHLKSKNGKLVAPGPDEVKIPRAMLWYYGLDKLVLT